MRMEDLSADQQKLLKTDFGSDIEKTASQQAKVAKEMYDKGLEIASKIADAMDKEAADQEKQAADHSLEDAGQEKLAAQMGAFIERGQYDGLQKLGQDRHGNKWHYVTPFVEEKVAGAAAKGAVNNFRKFIAAKSKNVVAKGKEALKANPGRAAAGAGAAGAAAGFAAGRSSKN